MSETPRPLTSDLEKRLQIIAGEITDALCDGPRQPTKGRLDDALRRVQALTQDARDGCLTLAAAPRPAGPTAQGIAQCIAELEIAKQFLHEAGTDPEAWIDGAIQKLSDMRVPSRPAGPQTDLFKLETAINLLPFIKHEDVDYVNRTAVRLLIYAIQDKLSAPPAGPAPTGDKS